MKHDGGAAFPSPGVVIVEEYGDEGETRQRQQGAYEGMSLRDYFAGQALTSLAALYEVNGNFALAERAYQMADSMLAARAAK